MTESMNPFTTTHTLLFTDVVDSTQFVERVGDARAAELWAEHDRRARISLALHQGLEIDRSDGFFLLFNQMQGAVHFALAYQAMVTELGLSARVGLHTGPITLRHNAAVDIARGAKPVEVEGLAKPLGARIMALAGGGQILLSNDARSALGDALPDGTQLESHGHYRLKGIEAPVEIFELGLPGHAAFAPPQDSAKAYRVVRSDELWLPLREVRHNLVAERDSFIGRSAELRGLASRLDAGSRLLTVLGPGGTGKTRLVRRYGLAWLGDWPGGVYFCDLSEARSLDGIHFAVAAALGVPLGKDDPTVQLGHAIAGRGRCLLILDNFEQVLKHAPATLGHWLDRAGEASFVITSRERLHLGGEEVLPIEPLALDSEAIELFAARAKAQRPEFTLSEHNHAAVAEVVRLLDGLPLAIELAAARVRVLSPAQIVLRMKDRFALLAGARGMAARQATLKAAIDWSWDLLSPWEQAALAQCSVFEGGFTLEAAEAVLDLQAWPEAPAAMDAVQSLVDKSLLRAWVPLEQSRYDIDEPYFGMYLSIHEYAVARLEGSAPGAALQVQQRHGDYFAGFGSDQAIEALSRHGGARRRRALALEIDNLVSACRRAMRRSDGPTAVPTYRAAAQMFIMRGPLALAVALGEQLLGLEQLAPTLRARALATLGSACRVAGKNDEAASRLEEGLVLATQEGDLARQGQMHSLLGKLDQERGLFAQAQVHFETDHRIQRDLGHRRLEGVAILNLGIQHALQSRLLPAVEHYERALAISREVGDQASEGSLLNNLGLLCNEQGRMVEARSHYEAALAIHRESADRRDEGLVLGNLGNVFLDRGLLDEAQTCYEQALRLTRDVGDRRFEGMILGNLGSMNFMRGRMGETRQHLDASLAIHREVGNRRSEGIVLGNLGALHRSTGDLPEAQRCFAQSLASHRSLGLRRHVGIALAHQADLLRELGQLGPAQTAFDESEAALREVHDQFELAKLLSWRCKAWRALGDTDRARAALAEAEAIAEQIDAKPDSELMRGIASARDLTA